MKTKRLIAILMVIIMAMSVRTVAQDEEYRFLEEGRTWSCQAAGPFHGWWSDYGYETRLFDIQIQGISTISGKEYSNIVVTRNDSAMNCQVGDTIAYLRESNGRVYMLRDKSFEGGFYAYGNPISEMLIYDMNLQAGDSLDVSNGMNWEDTDNWLLLDGPLAVDSVYTGVFEGNKRKVQKIKLWWEYYSIVIDGIGVINNGFLPFPYILQGTTGTYWIDYSTNRVTDADGTVLYQKPQSGILETEAMPNSKLAITHGSLAIYCEGAWRLNIYSVDGIQEMQLNGIDQKNIRLEQLPRGTHIAVLTTKEGTKTLKFAR